MEAISVSILVDENTRLCTSGITGREGTFHSLRHREYGQVVISYGTGDGQPALGLKVQQALADLGLYTEAMLPRFNR